MEEKEGVGEMDDTVPGLKEILVGLLLISNNILKTEMET